MASLLKRDPTPTPETVEKVFDGHLCRCTGYRPILDAMQSFAADAGDIEDIGTVKNPACSLACGNDNPRNAPGHKFVTADNATAWYTATTIADVFQIKDEHAGQDVRLVMGATGRAVYKDANPTSPRVYIYLGDIPELDGCALSSKSPQLEAGASVSLNTLHNELAKLGASDATKYAFFTPLADHIERVANYGIRNMATWAGNLMLQLLNKDSDVPFPGDMYTLLQAVGASVETVDPSLTKKTYTLDQLATVDVSSLVLTRLIIPFGTGQTLRTFKVMPRHQNAHATVNCAIAANVSDDVVISCTIVYGAIAGMPIKAAKTAAALVGQRMNESTLADALTAVAAEVVPASSMGLVEYKKTLILSLLYKWFLAHVDNLPATLKSAADVYKRQVSSGTMSFGTDPSKYPRTEPLPKLTATEQTSGRAVYTDDIPAPAGCVYGAFVTSTNASATIASIDTTAAEAAPGFIRFLRASDVPGQNQIGEQVKDEELFASTTVIYKGQSVGLVVADTQRHADDAAKLVKITYKDSKTPIVTMADAKAANSTFDVDQYMTGLNPLGDEATAQAAISAATNQVTGTVNIASQYAFYMEKQTALAVPGEGDELYIHASTQAARDMAEKLSAVVSLPCNAIMVTCRRAGGGFGTKGSRSEISAAAAAVAARVLGRPVRIAVTSDTDFEMIGKRHAYMTDYSVGFSDDGTITGLAMNNFADGGCTYDETVGTLSLGQLTCDNYYYFPAFYSNCVAYKTNTASNTSVRAPGSAQALFIIDAILEHVAEHLGLDPAVVRERNFYDPNATPAQSTPYGQPIADSTMGKLWPKARASYASARKDADTFNAANKWRKRGVAVIPSKYGVGSAGVIGKALVNIYEADGTVSVAHGGAEIGQGLSTKAAVAVAVTLGLDLDKVRVQPTSTITDPNPTQTGGSVSSNVTAEAAIDACNQLNERLAPFLKDGTDWVTAVQTAYASGVNMQASGVCIIAPGSGNPAVSSNSEEEKQAQVKHVLEHRKRLKENGSRILRNKGIALRTGDDGDDAPFFNYSVYGVAVSVVELDLLTGEVEILSSSLEIDAGESYSPLIDIGQAAGAFVMGIGHLLTEEVNSDATGQLLNNNTWTYKPPSTTDIPVQFDVGLLANVKAPTATLDGKSLGEPPLNLSGSVFFALKDAIRASGKTSGYFAMPAPATPAVAASSIGLTAADMTLSG